MHVGQRALDWAARVPASPHQGAFTGCRRVSDYGVHRAGRWCVSVAGPRGRRRRLIACFCPLSAAVKDERRVGLHSHRQRRVPPSSTLLQGLPLCQLWRVSWIGKTELGILCTPALLHATYHRRLHSFMAPCNWRGKRYSRLCASRRAMMKGLTSRRSPCFRRSHTFE